MDGTIRYEKIDKVGVITLKADLEYWPTVDLSRGRAGWERRLIPPPATASKEP